MELGEEKEEEYGTSLLFRLKKKLLLLPHNQQAANLASLSSGRADAFLPLLIAAIRDRLLTEVNETPRRGSARTHPAGVWDRKKWGETCMHTI